MAMDGPVEGVLEGATVEDPHSLLLRRPPRYVRPRRRRRRRRRDHAFSDRSSPSSHHRLLPLLTSAELGPEAHHLFLPVGPVLFKAQWA